MFRFSLFYLNLLNSNIKPKTKQIFHWIQKLLKYLKLWKMFKIIEAWPPWIKFTYKFIAIFAWVVIYLQSWYSGSMFENILENNLNIYAVTSTSAKEGSYSWYWDEEAVVNGTLLGTWLSDQFTAAWMVDADHFDIWDETLEVIPASNLFKRFDFIM